LPRLMIMSAALSVYRGSAYTNDISALCSGPTLSLENSPR